MRFRFANDDELPVVNTMCNATPERCRWGCGNQCAHPAPNESANEYFGDVARRYVSRRAVIGAGLAATGMLALRATPAGSLLGGVETARAQSVGALAFPSLPTSTADGVQVPPGYTARTLIRWGDPLTIDGRPFTAGEMTLAQQLVSFGFNNDYVGFYDLENYGGEERGALLVVNHEYTNPELMFPGYDAANPTKEHVDIELAAHGLSVVHIQKHRTLGWRYTIGAWHNRRVTGFSETRLTGPAAGHRLLRTSADPGGYVVTGMLNNCSAGRTPWGTVLTFEENFNQYFANSDLVADAATKAAHSRYGLTARASERKWERFYDRFDLAKEPNEAFRFGWVVEIDPTDPAHLPRKRTALGRVKHEATSTVVGGDGRVVVYTGDDERFDYMYKFVSSGAYDPANRAANLELLDSGTLYVAKFNDDGSGAWLPLVHGQGRLTAANGFADQGEVLIKARLAGDAVGATKMDRPEDIEVNPANNRVYAVMTNNTRRGTGTNPAIDGPNPRADNQHGHILEIVPAGGDHASTSFTWGFLLICGEPSDPSAYFGGFDKAQVAAISSPDNICFDRAGNLWIATDGQTGTLQVNDSVYAVPTAGPDRGHLRRFFNGVPGGEVASLILDDANETIFISIQHPGEGSTFQEPTSTFPDNGKPRPAVVFVTKDGGGTIGS